MLPRAWDGSGHFALAKIYSEAIFPDVFGWTDAFFSGVALPNYYPPLFYWLVALLHRTGLVPFATAFKIVLALPVLLLPASLWLLAWRVSGRDRLTATCAALAAVPLLVDVRLTNSTGLFGLSYTSTFLLGLYTQPLGFVLLISWYALFTSDGFARQLWRASLASLLLALALLANFFSSNVALPLALTVIAADAARLLRSTSPEGKKEASRALLAHLLSPLAGLCLTLFWLAPLLASYAYVVTRPEHVALSDLVPTPLWLWYTLAAAGALLWLWRGPSGASRPFVAACALLAAAVFIPEPLEPRWFPLQPSRLASSLVFLLSAPVGAALAFVIRLASSRFGVFGRSDVHGDQAPSGRAARHLVRRRLPGLTVSVFLLLTTCALMSYLVKPPPAGLAFYDETEWARVSPVLEFARRHRDGRYLVENQPFSDAAAAHDARAIGAYLGAQGNSSLTMFFREGSPNALFLDPLVDAFSAQPDSYGISSVLADDADFSRRTLAGQIERVRLYGTKYLVIRTQAMKDRLASEPSVSARYDFGEWSVFELAGDAPLVRALAYRPALVVADLTLKLRRRSDYGFARLAEEQFASGWFDVALALSPETRLDRLEVPDGFGSVVVDAYRYGDADEAYARLRSISRDHHLVLLSSDDPVFLRVRDTPDEFPRAEVIERARGRGDDAGWLDSDHPTRSYDDSPVRMIWRRLQQALDRGKVLTGVTSDTRLDGALRNGIIAVNTPPASGGGVPVLIASSFHPDWRREDGGRVYTATPFFMLTFVQGPTRVAFTRSRLDAAGLWASAATLLLVAAAVVWRYRGVPLPLASTARGRGSE